MSASTPTGVTFGSYRLVEKLGDGGMAMVYRGVVEGPEGFERPVVIKRILPHLSRDPKFVKMFLSEAKLCARLHHPAIVQVHALGDVGGEYFLAMEFVDGLDLATVLKRAYETEKRMSVGVACYIVSELASALGYAHALTDDSGRALEIVHRDVSPSNVMITKQGAVKLLDFGIARAAAHARMNAEKTRTGTLKGKISYMAPEQAEGQSVDARADLFALGILLYECLTLERLFRGEDEFETLRLVRECKVWPPSSRRPEIDPDIDAVVLRLLSKSPDARYQNGDELVAALAPLVHKHHADANQLKKYLAELGHMKKTVETEPTTPAKSPARVAAFSAEDSRKTPPRGKEPDTFSRSSGELQKPTGERRIGWRTASALGASLVVAAGAVWLAIGARAHKPATPVQPAVAVVPEKIPEKIPEKPPEKLPEKPPEKTVQITISGIQGAEITLDGAPAGKVPFELRLTPRPARRDLVVSHPGFQPLHRFIDGDRDVTVDATLRRRPHGRPPGADPEIKDPFGK